MEADSDQSSGPQRRPAWVHEVFGGTAAPEKRSAAAEPRRTDGDGREDWQSEDSFLRGSQAGQSAPSSPSQPSARSVVDEFIQALEDESLTQDERRRLAAALGEVLSSAEEPPQSWDVRLRQLEADFQAIHAYSDAMAEIIDEHGPADEFLESVRRDIESNASDIQALRRDLDRTRDARESLADRLETFEQAIDRVDARLERVADQVETIRGIHRLRLSKIERDVDDIWPAVDRVEVLSNELASLRDDVDDVQSRHRAIRRALTGDRSETTGQRFD